jgi:tRNA A-37 threonylcarbamoyl transferase component Bud32
MSNHGWKNIVCGRQRWWVDPAWREGLLDENGLRLPEWQRQGLVDVVKHSIHRTVYRIALAGQPIFVKYYPSVDSWDWLRRLVRPAKALREWARTLLLHRRAVPTITPLAAGTTSEGSSYFVSAALEGTTELYDFVQTYSAGWSLVERRAILQELGIFLARMFRHGVVHHDLHGGNLLVRQTPQGREWFLIDPYQAGVRQASPLHQFLVTLIQFGNQGALRSTELKSSLALLGMAFWPDLSPTDRLRVWRAFQSTEPSTNQWCPQNERGFLHSVEREVSRRTYAAWSKRAGRCMQINREFYQLEGQGWQAWASRTVPQSWLRTLMTDPEAPWRDVTTVTLKRSRHGQVGRITGPDGRGCIYKAFQPRDKIARWLGTWRKSPAVKCYQMAYALQLARVPTGHPLAVLQPIGGRGKSYLLLDYIADADGLIEYATSCRTARRRNQLQSVMRQLAKYIRRLHDFGLSHRDLKVTNLLVRERGGRPPEPVFVDLRGVRPHRWLTRSRRAKDLARLALSAATTLGATRTELLGFLKHYLGKNQTAWRVWWRLIARFAIRKVGRNLRRNRLVS